MIKLVIFDFDGVFTNGKVYFDNSGNIQKYYNVKDGVGIKLLKEKDINIGVISGYSHNNSQKEILKHLKIRFISLESNNKLDIVEEWCNKLNITLNNVAYMGDDINDIPVMNKVLLSGCPKDSCKECIDSCAFISSRGGGEGCVREFCELILKTIKRKTISGLICVKYVSTRLPLKNIRKFGNTTLLDIKIRKLLSLYFLDQVVVNTESEYIIEHYSQKYNDKKLIFIKRNKAYSRDNVENVDFCKHVVSNIHTEYVLYSPVTMPFIEKSTYQNMYLNMYKSNYDSIILAADGKQGKGHTFENHNFCFGASLIKVKDVIKFGDFMGKIPYFQECNSKERIDIDYPNEFNLSLYHYFNNDAIYGNENQESLKTNSLYNLDEMSSICQEHNSHKKQVKVIDVTIRDGGFDNNWNWDENVVKDMLKCASDSGIEYFEIGYLINPSLKKVTDGHYRNVSFDTIERLVEETNATCKISVLFDSWRYDIEQLMPRKETKIDLIRIVTYMEKNKLLDALEQCKKVKDKGYSVSLNIMCASYFTMDIIRYIKEQVIKNIDILDYIYFADSYGGMTPDQVKTIFSYIHDLKDINIGFHIHNNGQIGMANMIASLEYVDIIDASWNGMGRGMGNVRLEDVILFLIIKKSYNLNIESFLNYIGTNTDKKYINDIKNTLLGFLNIHPYRIQHNEDISLYNYYIYLNNLSLDKKYDYKII